MRSSGLLMRMSILLILSFSIVNLHVFAMTSTNYQINWDSINSGGDDISTSTNYSLHDTVGEQATGESTSTNYSISAGYRVGEGEEAQLSFNLGTQEDATGSAYTVFNNAGLFVTVNSTSSFSVDDMIGVVENMGLSQIIAVGKITSISGFDVYVDQWDGSPGSLSASPAGGDDFVYRLNGNSIDFGTLSASTGKTSLTATRVTSDAQNGYTVYVSENHDLWYSTTTAILDVADGTVTVGSEEYGWEVFGSGATSTGSDYAFTTTTRAIQQSSAVATTEERVGFVYKISINNNTPAGNYSHLVYYTVTANY
ncbi:MAG: hypothetical protein RDU25_06285 [Patescibacteria group bacterium]|nr:hypothetical protein [Patescibacteria group bacterium]